MDTLYRMDVLHPVITQSLVSFGSGLDKIKFVEVEVTRVINPKKYLVTFTVLFKSAGKDPVRLGLFSLFPSDNPGTFIVATSGQLRPEGEIELRLEEPEDYFEGDVLEVDVRQLRFRQN